MFFQPVHSKEKLAEWFSIWKGIEKKVFDKEADSSDARANVPQVGDPTLARPSGSVVGGVVGVLDDIVVELKRAGAGIANLRGKIVQTDANNLQSELAAVLVAASGIRSVDYPLSGDWIKQKVQEMEVLARGTTAAMVAPVVKEELFRLIPNEPLGPYMSVMPAQVVDFTKSSQKEKERDVEHVQEEVVEQPQPTETKDVMKPRSEKVAGQRRWFCPKEGCDEGSNEGFKSWGKCDTHIMKAHKKSVYGPCKKCFYTTQSLDTYKRHECSGEPKRKKPKIEVAGSPTLRRSPRRLPKK